MKIRPMTDVDKRAAAKVFVEAWTGRGDEKQDRPELLASTASIRLWD